MVKQPVLIASGAGMLFGLGLITSSTVDPVRVRGFLDVAGHWDPTLLFCPLLDRCADSDDGGVAGAAADAPARRRPPAFDVPGRGKIDVRLFAGRRSSVPRGELPDFALAWRCTRCDPSADIGAVRLESDRHIKVEDRAGRHIGLARRAASYRDQGYRRTNPRPRIYRSCTSAERSAQPSMMPSSRARPRAMVFGPAGLYPREVYPDQPPNRATIQENQAKLPGGYGFFSFSVRPSSFALSAVSAGSSAGSRASARTCSVLPSRPITICIIRTAAINATTASFTNLRASVTCTHRSAWRRILPFGRPAQWSISGDTSGRSPAPVQQSLPHAWSAAASAAARPRAAYRPRPHR